MLIQRGRQSHDRSQAAPRPFQALHRATCVAHSDKTFDLNLRSRPAAFTAVAATVCTAGCAGAPAHDILGSYFPSWMICALLGLVFALVVRQILVATKIDEAVPAPALVYLLMAVAFAFLLWLVWLS